MSAVDKKTRPTYEVMICDALLNLADRKGSSNVAIFKFIKDKYKFEAEEALKSQLKLALKRLSVSKKLLKVSRNIYKLSLGERKSLRVVGTKVALKKKVKKIVDHKVKETKSPMKASKTVKVQKTVVATPTKKSPKKEKTLKLKKGGAVKSKVKKASEGKVKKALKTKSMEASKTKSKASVKVSAEKIVMKGKAASAATKSTRRKTALTPAS